MSLTFKDWKFLQGSVGVSDVVTTVSAAHAVYGWLGGLDTVGQILRKIQSPFSKKLAQLKLESSLQLSGVSGQILTGHGLVAFTADDSQTSFGGDPRTQLVGLTLCALAHECENQIAYNLFTLCLLPALFDGPSPLADGLTAQLRDTSLLTRILNEGASRGLTQKFKAAIDGLNLPSYDVEWMRSQVNFTDKEGFQTSEVQFVGGLLKWIFKEKTQAYRTRSALAARVAACLRAVGYPIGDIQCWHGDNPEPADLNTNSILLVVGGTVSTDPFVLGIEEIPINPLTFVHHYNIKTMGSLFLTALYHQCDTYPEVFQAFFDETNHFIETNSTLSFASGTSELILRPKWSREPTGDLSPIARRLAAIYFPLSADFVAPCYNHIATQDILKKVLDHKRARNGDASFPNELATFRVITASLVFAMAFNLMKEESRKTRHSTGLFLGSEDWLLPMCRVLDQGYYDGIQFHHAVFVLAAIHAAKNPEDGFPENGNIIGWRNQSYTVIPSLLAEMCPVEISPRFCCFDVFLANIKTYEDGSIKDSASPALFRLEDAVTTSDNDSQLTSQHLASNWIGRPQPRQPDVQLYLAFETPLHYNSIDLCLAARIGGSVVGTVSIKDVLRTLKRSAEDATACRICDPGTDVFNVSPSEWARNARYKPIGRGLPTYIAVQDDDAWTIFLAGQTKQFNGRVVFGCIGCSMRKFGGENGILVGYA